MTKEVEAMMVELSFDKLLDHFAAKLKISNEKEIIGWNLISECRERRHLIVHNASLVNKKYLIRTGNPYKLKLGDTVHVDREYFAKAYIEFYLAGLLLCYNCWGAWDKETTDGCVENILDESFSLLTQKEYEATYKLTDYATKNIESRNDDQEDDLVRINFNKLIALRKLDRKAIFDKELKKVKTGTSAPIYKLVHAILADKHEDLVALIKLAKGMEDLDAEDYEKWPIFDFVRDIPELHTAISKELGIHPSSEDTTKEGGEDATEEGSTSEMES